MSEIDAPVSMVANVRLLLISIKAVSGSTLMKAAPFGTGRGESSGTRRTSRTTGNGNVTVGEPALGVSTLGMRLWGVDGSALDDVASNEGEFNWRWRGLEKR